MYKYTTNENIPILVLNAKKNSFPVLLFVGKVVFLLLPWRSWSLRWFWLRSWRTFFFHGLPLKFLFFFFLHLFFPLSTRCSLSLLIYIFINKAHIGFFFDMIFGRGFLKIRLQSSRSVIVRRQERRVLAQFFHSGGVS